MIKRLLKLSYAIVVVSLLFTQYSLAQQTDADLAVPKRLGDFAPVRPQAQLSSDGNTLYNAGLSAVYVPNLDPSHVPVRIPAPFDLLSLPASATASFSITYVPNGGTDIWGDSCVDFPADAKLAFDAAASIWANIIQSSVPITINACWADLSSDPKHPLGRTSWPEVKRDFPNAPRADAWYAISLANALAGSDLNTTDFDMHITYNLTYPWYYGTDGNTPSTQYDLMSVVLHEIAHGLNFSGSMSYSSGSGSWGYGTGYPNIYDTFMRDGLGNQLIDTAIYPNPSTALGGALTSNDIWFHGSNAMAANGGQRVKIYAPSTWVDGSSYHHLDNTTFNGTLNQLMVYAISPGESIHDPGPVTIGLLQDLGWQTFYSRSAIDGFNPDASSTVSAIAVQADGKILIGGNFTKIGGLPRNYIARLNENGTVDPAFNPNANATVRSIAVLGNGSIVIGGDFTLIGGETRNYIARLNADGILDTDFNPDILNDSVDSIAVQAADGKILIGGSFTTIGGETRNYIARLNEFGSLDTGFNANIENGNVGSIALQADGRILIGGLFTTISGEARHRIARLYADGSLDKGFIDPDANGTVLSIAVQADGKILIGGEFYFIGPVVSPWIARLNTNGALDTDFINPNPNEYVGSIALQADGRILIGGLFTKIGAATTNHIARLNADGSLDTGFNPNAGSTVRSIALQTDGKILIGGTFTTIGGVTRNRIARLYADGTLDRDLNPNASYMVYSVAVQADGKILIGGEFAAIGGVTRNWMARLNPDGSLDSGFNPNVNANVNDYVDSIAVQADGKILIGGWFSMTGGAGRNHIARLKSDGSLDSDFDPGAGANGNVSSIAIQTDGRILIGGNFTSIGGKPRNYIARLYENGSLDESFNANITPRTGGNVSSIAIQTDGTILVGGNFTTIGGQARNYIARLNENGTVDPAFNPNANATVRSIAVLGNGSIVIGGDFTLIGGVAKNFIALLNADGILDPEFSYSADDAVYSIAVEAGRKIVIGGLFSTVFSTIDGVPRHHVARFYKAGISWSLDSGFTPQANATVQSMALQADGKILVGGDFTSVGGQPRNYIARLANTDAAIQDLSVSSDGTSVTWMRWQASPEVWRVTFEHSPDGVTWTSLGNGTRNLSRGWQLTGLSLPFNQNHYVRARGYATDGINSSLFESVRMYYLSAGTMQFSSATYSLNENGGSVLITVTRIGGSSGAVGVSYATSNGTATAGLDYASTSGTLSWASGDTANKTFSVPITNDTLDEPNETFTVTLTSPTGGATLGSPSGATVTIMDDDPTPTVQFSVASSSGSEATTPALVTVTLSAASGQIVEVNYATANGTATAGSDYTATSGTLTFNPGVTSQTISVPIINDTAVEPNETFTVTLSGPVNATLGAITTHTYTIIDDDNAGTIQFSSATYSVNENGGNVLITVTRIGGSSGAVGVSYATSNGTATAGLDYASRSGTLSWASGDTANKTFSVPITNDTLDEPNETFTVTLTSPTGGATLGSPSGATVTIIDDDPPPTVQFSAASSSGSEATTPASITVTLSAASGRTVTVRYATANGTATAGSDYTARSGRLTFNPGVTSQTISVPIINDTAVEPNETFKVTLSGPVNATLGAITTHTYTIIDDDNAGTIQFSSATYSVNENGGSVLITVTRVGGSSGAVGISYATSNGTATAGSDYSSTSGTLSWANGDSSNKTFSVPILDDSAYEGNETVNLTLSSPTGGATLGSPSTAVLNIIDDKRPHVDFDKDGKTDIAVWRPGTGYWYIISSKDGSIISEQWGSSALNDVLIPGDYDGDGKTDIAIWRPVDGYWYIIGSKDGSIISEQWGAGYAPYNDVPVPGDYDGDGKTDIAIWRPADGFWYIIGSKDGSIISEQWGAGYAPYNDVPVPGDYDGDGKTDIAVWRPGDGFWYTINSKDGSITATQWGSSALNDVPVPGDYDGDGKTDIAVWRPEDGFWYIISSKDGSIISHQWGAGYAPYNDVPVPGDYDGDGKTDIAVWRPGDGYWYIINSKDGGITATQWGAGSLNDEPISQLVNW